jgi:hypothetical protein
MHLKKIFRGVGRGICGGRSETRIPKYIGPLLVVDIFSVEKMEGMMEKGGR